MSIYALWIDHKDAHLYKFSPDKIEEKSYKAHTHHGRETAEDVKKFYHDLAKDLNDAEELLLMGPGTAKNEFKHHCESHHHANVAKHIVGIETMASHPTRAQMLDTAKKFFTNFHQWVANY